MKKKIKITFLLDPKNNWMEKYIKKNFLAVNKKFQFKISKNYQRVFKQNIVFILGYTKILPNNFLKKNNLNLVVHESNLPKGKGFSPVQWQILKNQNKIPICLIEAIETVDSGPILAKSSFNLEGNELNEEIRLKQAVATIKIIKKFLKKFPNFSQKKQVGLPTFYKRRYPKDSLLDLNKSLKNNFNLLRIADNLNYPAYFIYKGKKYILKIYKD